MLTAEEQMDATQDTQEVAEKLIPTVNQWTLFEHLIPEEV